MNLRLPMVLLCTIELLGLSACRFGNHTSQSGGTADSGIKYYGTTPSSLKLCVETTTNTHCMDQATGETPGLIANIMTDPVRFAITNARTSEAIFVPYDNDEDYMPVWVRPDQKGLYFSAHYEARPLWRDDKCLSQRYLEEEGKLIDGKGEPIKGRDGTTQGRVELLVRVTYHIADRVSGGCAASLAEIQECYADLTRCGANSYELNRSLQDVALGLFGPYIDAAAMTRLEISDVRRLSYEIQYF